MTKSPAIRKILQALYYIQSRSNNEDRFNRVYLLKMLYFADRYHLRHFGLLISNDNYVAMKLGPVASTTLDVLKKNTLRINSAETDYLYGIKDISENDVEIGLQGDDELSESAKESLDFALREMGHYRWWTQSELSHCYPEWKKHEKEVAHTNSSAPMTLQDFLDDPDDDTCFLKFNKKEDPFKEDKEFLTLLKSDLAANAISA